jgi:hypothetical protein
MTAAILAVMSLLLLAMIVTKLPLVVRIYDVVGVPLDALERAHVTVDQTMNGVGIRPVWRQCRASLCVDPPKPDELIVRIVKAGKGGPLDLLGSSMVDLQGQAGTLATIYEDRVESLAIEAHVDSGRLLGRAIAHEIGHLLLGTPSHAPMGLMRACWRTGELQRDWPPDWMLSGWEGSRMRWRLLVRGRPSTER